MAVTLVSLNWTLDSSNGRANGPNAQATHHMEFTWASRKLNMRQEK